MKGDPNPLYKELCIIKDLFSIEIQLFELEIELGLVKIVFRSQEVEVIFSIGMEHLGYPVYLSELIQLI